VKVKVGREKQQKEFSVHFDVLCRKAPEFGKILKDDSPIGHNESLDLPEDDAVAFEMFMCWLYQGKIEEPSASQMTVRRAWLPLVAFAEKYNVSDFADTAMGFLVKDYVKIGEIPWSGAPRAYRLTRTGSRLRGFYIKSLAYSTLHHKNWRSKTLCIHLKAHEDMLPDFLEELRMQSGALRVRPTNLPACAYHGHGKDEPCPTASKKCKRNE
jgi:hypothetical protein